MSQKSTKENILYSIREIALIIVGIFFAIQLNN